jgi:hypothetical protein
LHVYMISLSPLTPWPPRVFYSTTPASGPLLCRVCILHPCSIDTVVQWIKFSFNLNSHLTLSIQNLLDGPCIHVTYLVEVHGCVGMLGPCQFLRCKQLADVTLDVCHVSAFAS